MRSRTPSSVAASRFSYFGPGRGPEPAVDVVGAPPAGLFGHLLDRAQRPVRAGTHHQVDTGEQQQREQGAADDSDLFDLSVRVQ